MRLPLLAALLLATPLAAQEVRPYSGKYADDPRCGDFLKGLPAAMREAARAMSERLGLPPSEAADVVLQLADRPLGPQKDVDLGGTSTRNLQGRVVQWITLNPESHFAAAADFDEELAHEMTHALLRTALGGARYRLLPKWAREGLAVWAAGQGPARMAFWLTIEWEKPDPVGALLNGLENEKHSLEDYPEDYLAIAWLESEKGVEGVRAFVRLLAEGKDCAAAAEAASGRAWTEFVAESAAFSRARLGEVLGTEAPAAMKAVMATYRDVKDWEAAHRGFFAIATRHADTWAGALAAYYEGRALQQAGRFAEAAAALREFLLVAGTRTGLMDDAWWNIGLCEEQDGHADAAIAAFDRLARDYSYSPQSPAGLLRAASICGKAGRDDEARARYERIARDLPGTKAAEEARAKLDGR